MSDLSVSEADGIVLIKELEERFGFIPVIVTNEDGSQEIKALIPKDKATIDLGEEE